MKLVINGQEFDAGAQPFIGDLRLLRKEFGFGWGEVVKRLQGMDEDTDMFALLDDEGFLDALVAWMWMAKLRAGDRDTTREDMERVAIDQIQWIAEPCDVLPEDESVPTSAPAGSARGAAAPEPAPATTQGSTKTSTKRSTAA